MRLFFFLTFIFLTGAQICRGESSVRGPIKISADETTSREKGKIIEAKGNVHISYEMESRDLLESQSDFARFDESNSTGELLGSPKAIWKRMSKEPTITLTADRILLDLSKERLSARGNGTVNQTDSILTAQEIDFSNIEKRLDAQGGRPEFFVATAEHKTRISSERMTAWTEDKIIYFNEKVHGIILPNDTAGD